MKEIPMLVRVAKAIAASRGHDVWTGYLPAARAAMLAMRDPTPDMLEAATRGLPDWGDLPDDWRAMIDHAALESER